MESPLFFSMTSTLEPSQRVRVYYLSSGVIGAPILDALLLDERIELVGIGSQPDRPSGRRQTMTPTAFAAYALSRGCQVERIGSVSAPQFSEHLAALGVELLLVVAFGQLLREKLLNQPRFGCLNVHASLLPRYRGACPISAAILNGDGITGVSFMRMDKGLDTGPVYCSCQLEIGSNETAGQLEERLGHLAAINCGDVIWGIARQGLQPEPQPASDEPNVHKISKNDGAINWSLSATRIFNMVRAYQPWPRAFTFVPVQGVMKRIQVTSATAEPDHGMALEPGQVLADSADELCIACNPGILRIHRIIPEGRKEMPARDFLRGNPVTPGCVLE